MSEKTRQHITTVAMTLWICLIDPGPKRKGANAATVVTVEPSGAPKRFPVRFNNLQSPKTPRNRVFFWMTIGE